MVWQHFTRSGVHCVMDLFDIYQQRQIDEASAKASSTKNRVDEVLMHVGHLEQQISRLQLTCQAMWEVLRDHTGVGEEHVLLKMEEIDLRDGKADGKISPAVTVCAACDRPVNTRHKQCMYCGAQLTSQTLFGGG
jgi:hypothetical protein